MVCVQYSNTSLTAHREASSKRRSSQCRFAWASKQSAITICPRWSQSYAKCWMTCRLAANLESRLDRLLRVRRFHLFDVVVQLYVHRTDRDDPVAPRPIVARSSNNMVKASAVFGIEKVVAIASI